MAMKFWLVYALVSLAEAAAVCNLDHCLKQDKCGDSYICKQLRYEAATGKFSGTLSTNSCPRNAVQSLLASVNYIARSAECKLRNFPSIAASPSAIPFGSEAGVLLGGELLYGPLEVGIHCVTDKGGACAAGIDPNSCRDELSFLCPKSYTDTTDMNDACGFASSPYHAHVAPSQKCFYDNFTVGHSPLLGIANDGYGIYGMYEKNSAIPTDLDACNGHVGVIQDEEAYPLALVGITDFKRGQGVYHYHTSGKFPFTMGCYGPATYDECTQLTLRDESGRLIADNRATCGTYVPVQDSGGDIYYYDDFCNCGYGDKVNGVKAGKRTLPKMMQSDLFKRPSALCWPFFGGWTSDTQTLTPTSREGYKTCNQAPSKPFVSAASAGRRLLLLGVAVSPPVLATVVASLMAASAVQGT